jgi:hypothetical protein
MSDVGLNPADSRLALPGCKSNRYTFCDGAKHNCAITVDETGQEVIRVATSNTPAALDFSLKTLRAGHSLMS